MKIIPIPLRQDHYSYLIVDERTREGAVVDPVEPKKVLQVAEDNWVDLKTVLTTHHHQNHAGGNDEMKRMVPTIKIFGGFYEDVKACTHKVRDGDKIVMGVDTKISCLHTPGHTSGHMCYYVTGEEGEDPAVFTGDTLFVAGCGKLYEGTPEEMHHSLCSILATLPKQTRVYGDHEYTMENLQFALTIEPGNARILQKLSWAQQKRMAGLPTVPSTIEEELQINPFMRVDLPEVQDQVGCKSAVEAFRELRQRKDNWEG